MRLLLLSLLAFSFACEDTATPALEDAGDSPDARTPGVVDGATSDGGDEEEEVREPVSLNYQPGGCDYEVRTPEVDEVGRSEEVYGEEAFVDHVHISHAGPSHTSFAVNWRTDLDTLASTVIYGTNRGAVQSADDGSGAASAQLGHHMRYFTGSLTQENVRVHEAHVCGLEPGTRYFYKVGGRQQWSEVFAMTTAPPPGSEEPWSFGVTGDSRNHIENAWAISQKRVFDRAVDLQIFSGDAVVLGTFQGQWDQFFEASVDGFEVEDLFAQVPFMPANGNHEALAVNYVAQFAVPQDQSEGERAQGEEWYSYDYANAHFVVLNDTVDDPAVIDGAQARWLRNDLESVDREETPWVFVYHHRGFYTCRSTHSPDTSLRAAWQPVFDDFEVDMVFGGHNHVYERSVPIRGLQDGQGVTASAARNAVPVIDADGRPSGTVYVIAAAAGAPLYDVSDQCEFSHVAHSIQNYVVVEIENRELRYTAYNAMTDTELDSFSYRK